MKYASSRGTIIKKARGNGRAFLQIFIYNLYNICTGFTEESVFQDFHDFFQGRTEMDRGKVFLFDESKV